MNKDFLLKQEYDFLKNNEHLGKNIIYLTYGGSHAYGTNNENSDIDVRGICLERQNDIIGLSSFEQVIDNNTDTTIYGLRKIFSLLLNCNPNVIEMLGTRNEDIFYISEPGQLLRDNIDLFISKKAINSFGGYANQQLKRLNNALARDVYNDNEKESHVLDSINRQMNTFKDRYKDLCEEELKLYIDKSEKTNTETEIFMDLNLKKYPLRDFKNIYSEMSSIVSNYGSLNHRNKKDDIHLYKHCMHLIRLFVMGIEILEGKGVNTYRKDKELLLDIRNKKYSIEEIKTMVDKYSKDFSYAAENTDLKSKPDYKKAEELLMHIYKKYVFKMV